MAKSARNATGNKRAAPAPQAAAAIASRASSRRIKPRRLINVSHGEGKSYDKQPESNLQEERFSSFEEKGREAWNKGRGQNGVLDRFDHKHADFGFFPKCLGSKKDVKEHGREGTHYAAGYSQLGEMVERQGEDYSKWPRLTIAVVPNNKNNNTRAAQGGGAQNNNKSGERERDSDSDDTVSMSSSSSSSVGSADHHGNQDRKERPSTAGTASAAVAGGPPPPAAVVIRAPAPVTPAAAAAVATANHRSRRSTSNTTPGGVAATVLSSSSSSSSLSSTTRNNIGNTRGDHSVVAANDSNHDGSTTAAEQDKTARMTKQDIEVKREEMSYKMDLLRNYRELKKDPRMTETKIARIFPDMVQFFSDNEEEA